MLRQEAPRTDSLSTLEAARSQLLEEFLGLGDLRRGSITAVVRRCGKPTCHCAKPNDGGHDPQFRLTRRVAGKTVTESFPNPAALRKAQKEVAEFRRFQIGYPASFIPSAFARLWDMRLKERARWAISSEPLAGSSGT